MNEDDETVVLPIHGNNIAVASTFDATGVRAAIKKAQQLVPDYMYKGFRKKVAAAGCACYVVSFSSRRVLHFGRTAETHVEHFSD